MSQSSPIEQCRSYLPQLSLIHDPHLVCPEIIEKIHNLSDQDLCGGPIGDHDMAQAARAGLLLIAGAFEEAHGIVQELETLEAYYWHGIVHRQEPDWFNAKYWFRRLGHHVVFDELMKVITQESSQSNQARDIMGDGWDAFAFVDLCQTCQIGKNLELEKELLILQQHELKNLLEHCLRGALRSKVSY